MRTETRRKITKVEPDEAGGATRVHMDCGHVAEWNPIYTYKVGSVEPCYRCSYPEDAEAEQREQDGINEEDRHAEMDDAFRWARYHVAQGNAANAGKSATRAAHWAQKVR